MASKAAASASDTHTRAVASQSTSVLANKDTGIGGFFRAAGHHDSAAADKAADGGKSGSKSLDPGKPKPSFGGGKLRSAARKAKGVGMLQRTVTDLAESGADDFEQYGSLAGPPEPVLEYPPEEIFTLWTDWQRFIQGCPSMHDYLRGD